MYRLWASAIAFLFVAGAAQAQLVRENGYTFVPGTLQALHCVREGKTYGAASPDAPPIIANTLAGDGGRFVIHTCTDGEHNTHYFLREPRPNRDGVCRIYENEIFPGTEENSYNAQILYDTTNLDRLVSLRGWKGQPPQSWYRLRYAPRREAAFGFLTDEACPPGDDPRYLSLSHVSDGTLKAFFGAWKRATATRETVNRTFAMLVTKPADLKLDDREMARLRGDALAWLAGGTIRIGGIRCDDEGCLAYGEKAPDIGFDVAPDGIRFTSINTIETVN